MMKILVLSRLLIIAVLTVASGSAMALTCYDLDGSYIYAGDGTYLGFFGNKYATDSINNTYGNYGSSYASKSVRNSYGNYGSQYASLSATNPYSTNPPTIFKSGTAIARLTANQYVSGAISLVTIDATCSFNSSSAITAATPTTPATLTGLVASDGLYTDGVQLTWNTSQGATSYTIYVSTTATGSRSFISETPNTSISVVGGTPGIVYFYFVFPKNSAGLGDGLYDTGHIAASVNTPPIVSIVGGSRTVSDTNNTQGETVALTATATDSDGSIASTQWLVADQVIATGTTANLPLSDGATVVTFRATDNSGATTSTTATITVSAPVPVNKPPVVNIVGGNRAIADTNGTGGEFVNLTATATDSDGTIVSSNWLINNEVVGSGESARLYLEDGQTTVTFRSTDDGGISSSSSVTIIVVGRAANYLDASTGLLRFTIDAGDLGMIVASFAIVTMEPVVVIQLDSDSITPIQETVFNIATFDGSTGRLLIPELVVDGNVAFRNLSLILSDGNLLQFTLESVD